MNLWKGEFIMRKNVKIIVGVVVLILVLVVGSFVGLIINRTNDHKFGRYVSSLRLPHLESKLAKFSKWQKHL